MEHPAATGRSAPVTLFDLDQNESGDVRVRRQTQESVRVQGGPGTRTALELSELRDVSERLARAVEIVSGAKRPATTQVRGSAEMPEDHRPTALWIRDRIITEVYTCNLISHSDAAALLGLTRQGAQLVVARTLKNLPEGPDTVPEGVRIRLLDQLSADIRALGRLGDPRAALGLPPKKRARFDPASRKTPARTPDIRGSGSQAAIKTAQQLMSIRDLGERLDTATSILRAEEVILPELRAQRDALCLSASLYDGVRAVYKYAGMSRTAFATTRETFLRRQSTRDDVTTAAQVWREIAERAGLPHRMDWAAAAPMTAELIAAAEGRTKVAQWLRDFSVLALIDGGHLTVTTAAQRIGVTSGRVSQLRSGGQAKEPVDVLPAEIIEQFKTQVRGNLTESGVVSTGALAPTSTSPENGRHISHDQTGEGAAAVALPDPATTPLGGGTPKLQPELITIIDAQALTTDVPSARATRTTRSAGTVGERSVDRQAPSPEQAAENHRVGRRGEHAAYLAERRRLAAIGLTPELAVWVSKADELADHDIQSVDEDGDTLYIEVKATKGSDPGAPFLISQRELDLARAHGPRFVIYRVTDVDSAAPCIWRIPDPLTVVEAGVGWMEVAQVRMSIPVCS